MTIFESVSFLVINVLFFLSQYLKFSQLTATKLYFLEAFVKKNLPDHECAICLLQCIDNEKIIRLPCFSEHIYHY